MFTLAFWKAATERAVKTAAQTLILLIGAGTVGITALNWPELLGLTATAALLSVLTSVASGAVDGNPSATNSETTTDGRHEA
jgi:hypothetical protein